MEKKSQFKIQQMVFMLLAVFLFFILVALFYVALQYRNLHTQAFELEQSKAILTSEFLAASSEFSCSGEGKYCIDTDKALLLQGRSAYKGLWPVAFIKVRKLDNKQEKECNKVNYPNCNIYKVYQNKNIEYKGTGQGSFVALCRYEQVSGYATRICELGKLIIGYETK